MRAFAFVLAVALAGCGPSSEKTGPDAGSPDAAPTGDDAGRLADAATAADAGADAGPRVVDPSTLTGKLVMGYQGWFLCPGDGSPPDRWVHWFRGDGTPTIDMWPDMSELPASERCPTNLTLPGGAPAHVYSAWNPATVARHFRWMREHDLDGVLLQRFTSELGDPAFKAARDRVAENVRAGAEAEGRVFAVMYDISGQDPSTLRAVLEADWRHLVDTLKLTESPRYLRHRGKPLLAIWGFGFADRPGTPADAQAVIRWFRTDAPAAQQATLLGGVPRDWRDDAAWAPTIRQFDVISPWTVGAFVDDAGANAYRTRLAADLANATAAGADYLPVVFPGFSWKNLNNGPLNQIPRRAGRFYWRQVYNAIGAGSTMLYGAMFDEVDEGTAMFKLAPTAAELPTQFPFLPLDADGTALPSDFYLRVADAAGRMLRGDIALTATLPVTP